MYTVVETSRWLDTIYRIPRVVSLPYLTTIEFHLDRIDYTRLKISREVCKLMQDLITLISEKVPDEDEDAMIREIEEAVESRTDLNQVTWKPLLLNIRNHLREHLDIAFSQRRNRRRFNFTEATYFSFYVEKSTVVFFKYNHVVKECEDISDSYVRRYRMSGICPSNILNRKKVYSEKNIETSAEKIHLSGIDYLFGRKCCDEKEIKRVMKVFLNFDKRITNSKNKNIEIKMIFIIGILQKMWKKSRSLGLSKDTVTYVLEEMCRVYDRLPFERMVSEQNFLCYRLDGSDMSRNIAFILNQLKTKYSSQLDTIDRFLLIINRILVCHDKQAYLRSLCCYYHTNRDACEVHSFRNSTSIDTETTFPHYTHFFKIIKVSKTINHSCFREWQKKLTEYPDASSVIERVVRDQEDGDDYAERCAVCMDKMDLKRSRKCKAGVMTDCWHLICYQCLCCCKKREDEISRESEAPNRAEPQLKC